MSDLSSNTGVNLAKGFLQSISQVFFQESPWTGILFLIGIFWGSYASGAPACAWGLVVGVLCSNFAGWIVGQPKEDGVSGLWGFNGALVGMAFPTFLGNTPLMWVALIVCSMLSTWVRTGFNYVMAPWKVNSLTFPFVFTTWLFLLSSRILTGLEPAGLPDPGFVATAAAGTEDNLVSFGVQWLKGISQVFLVDNWITGILFLAGLLICTPMACLWAAFSSLIALLVGWWFGMPESYLSAGLYGYSSVLTGIAVGTVFYKSNLRVFFWTVVAVIATLFIQAASYTFLAPFGISPLTGPFCLTTWLFLLPRFALNSPDEPDHSHWHLHWSRNKEAAQPSDAAPKTTAAPENT